MSIHDKIIEEAIKPIEPADDIVVSYDIYIELFHKNFTSTDPKVRIATANLWASTYHETSPTKLIKDGKIVAIVPAIRDVTVALGDNSEHINKYQYQKMRDEAHGTNKASGELKEPEALRPEYVDKWKEFFNTIEKIEKITTTHIISNDNNEVDYEL